MTYATISFEAAHTNATIDELQTLLAKAHDEQDNRKRRVAFNLVCTLCHHLRQALLPVAHEKRQMQVAVLHARISTHYILHRLLIQGRHYLWVTVVKLSI